MRIIPQLPSWRIPYYLKLSCWMFSLNQLASWGNLLVKLGFLLRTKTLGIFLSVRKFSKFDFCWVFYFLMIKFDCFEYLDDSWLLNSNVDQKVKVWLLSDGWLFISWFNSSTINHLHLWKSLEPCNFVKMFYCSPWYHASSH